MRAAVVGVGAVGARCARQLLTVAGLDELVLLDVRTGRAEAVVGSLGAPARASSEAAVDLVGRVDVAVLALPADQHRVLAERCLTGGTDVVSVVDDATAAAQLLDLDSEARERGRTIVVGAGFSPGLTCLLARHAASEFSAIDEIHLAKTGTGGPACARQHHAALAAEAADWRDGAWVRRPAGSGRELCFFPDPVGGLDCYRTAAADPVLLRGAFPGATRITARMSASRRDRVTARLPMLRRPHAEGAIGAVRVEVRGRRAAATDARVLGAIDRPAVAAGAVAAIAAAWAAEGRFARTGAAGLAELAPEPVPFLAALAECGVRAAVFEGADA